MRKDKKYKEKSKEVYKLSNWSSYNKSLVNRCDIRIWLSAEVKSSWYYSGLQKPGGEIRYSNACIEFCLSMKYLFGLGYRQVEGFIKSLLSLAKVNLGVPSYTQMQRRSKSLAVDIQVRKRKKGPINLVLDSTGLKVYGEGEWKVRKHGYNKFRTWRLLHMGSDGMDLEILTVSLTNNKVSDSKAGVGIIKQLKCEINKVAADGHYDTKAFRGCLSPGVEQLIPPRRDASMFNGKVPEFNERDKIIKRIKQVGRKKWKAEVGYHIRSKSEVNMYRYKTIFGGKMNARKFEFEQTEIQIKSKILNQFIEIGMPKSYKAS